MIDNSREILISLNGTHIDHTVATIIKIAKLVTSWFGDDLPDRLTSMRKLYCFGQSAEVLSSLENILDDVLVLFRMTWKRQERLSHTDLYYFHFQISNHISSLNDFLLLNNGPRFMEVKASLDNLQAMVSHTSGHSIEQIWAAMLPRRNWQAVVKSRDASEKILEFSSKFDGLHLSQRGIMFILRCVLY